MYVARMLKKIKNKTHTRENRIKKRKNVSENTTICICLHENVNICAMCAWTYNSFFLHTFLNY